MNYNTDINIIGGIPDFHLIYTALPLLYRQDADFYNNFVVQNDFNFRTENARKRFLRALKSAFVNPNMEINELISILLVHYEAEEKSKALLVFWAFSLNNSLFYQLNRDIFFKNLYLGRTDLPTADVEAYLKDLISRAPELKDKWSDSTIKKVASKYLTILRKLSLVEGKQKKTFSFTRISDELLACFVHIASLREDRKSNFLKDEFAQCSFVPPEDLVERIKQIGKNGWIEMNYTGTSLKAEGIFDAKNIIDGIFG